MKLPTLFFVILSSTQLFAQDLDQDATDGDSIEKSDSSPFELSSTPPPPVGVPRPRDCTTLFAGALICDFTQPDICRRTDLWDCGSNPGNSTPSISQACPAGTWCLPGTFGAACQPRSASELLTNCYVDTPRTFTESCTGAAIRAKRSFCNFDVDSDPCVKTSIHMCGNLTTEITCADAFGPDKPFCLETSAGTARCVGKDESALLTRCTAPVTFDCRQEGIVPNPTDCTRYFRCARNAAGTLTVTENRQCRAGYVFDPSLPDADPCRFTKGNSAVCVTANCGMTPGLRILSYPFYKSKVLGEIGVFCRGTAGPPTVFRCGRGQFLRAQGIFNVQCV